MRKIPDVIECDTLEAIYAVTDEWGRARKRFTFDAWGKRVTTQDTHAGSGGKVTRGFADHEMPEDFGFLKRRDRPRASLRLYGNLNITLRIQRAFELGEPTLGEKGTYRTPGGLMRLYCNNGQGQNLDRR